VGQVQKVLAPLWPFAVPIVALLGYVLDARAIMSLGIPAIWWQVIFALALIAALLVVLVNQNERLERLEIKTFLQGRFEEVAREVSGTQNVTVAPPKRLQAIRPLYIHDLASTTRMNNADITPGFSPAPFIVVAAVEVTETEPGERIVSEVGQISFLPAKERKTAIESPLVVEAAIRKEGDKYVALEIVRVKPTKI